MIIGYCKKIRLSLLLLVIIVFSISFLIDADNNNTEININKSESPSEERKPLMELKGERTLFSRKILNNDGTITKEFSSLPMFYENENGELVEIETTLEEVGKTTAEIGGMNKSEYSFAAIKNSLKTFFSRSNKGGVKFEVEDIWVKVRPLNTSKSNSKLKSELEHKDNKLKYFEVWPGVDLEYVVMPGMLKENIILNSPEHQNSFQFEILSPKLSVVKGMEGELNLVNNQGEKVLTFPVPFLIDSSKKPMVGPAYFEILSRKGNKTLIEISVDEGWLSQNDLTYPVILDPTVSLSNYGSKERRYFTINFNQIVDWQCKVWGHDSWFGLVSEVGYFKIFRPDGVKFLERAKRYNGSVSYSGSFQTNMLGRWSIVIGGTNSYSGGRGSVTYEIDSTGPEGYIKINNDEAGTKSSSVTLALSASDYQSGVDKMRFSNNSSSYSAWQAYTTSKNWNLNSGDGTKTVYVQFKDKAGNISRYSDQIILDTTPPEIKGLGVEKNTGSVTVNWVFEDNLIGMSTDRPYQYAITTTSNKPETGIHDSQSDSKIFNGLNSNDSYFVWVRAFDDVGNVSQWYRTEEFSPLPEPVSSFGIESSAGVEQSTGQPFYQINLTLPDVDCNNYIIERNKANPDGSYDPSNWSTIANLSYAEMKNNNFQYNDKNLDAHGKYRYRVYTKNAVGDESEKTYNETVIKNIRAVFNMLPEDNYLTNNPEYTFNIPTTDIEGDELRFRVIYKLNDEQEQNSGSLSSDPVTINFNSDGEWQWWLEIEESNLGFSETYVREKRIIKVDTTAPEGTLKLVNTDLEEYTVGNPTRTQEINLDISELNDSAGVIDSGIKEVHVWNGVNKAAEFFTLKEIMDSENDIYPEYVEMIANGTAGVILSGDNSYNIPWILANGSDGERNVTMEVKDNAGNISKVTKTCFLDTTPPESPILDGFSHNHSIIENEKIIIFNWLNSVDDVIFFTGRFEIAGDIYHINPDDIIITNEDKIVKEASYKVNVNELGYNQPVKIQIVAVDRAGNESTISTSYTAYTRAKVGTISDISGGYDGENWAHYIQFVLEGPEPAGSASSHLMEYGRMENNEFSLEGTIELSEGKSYFIHSNLQPHQEKNYRLVALNSSGDKSYGTPFTAIVPNTTPTAPVIGENSYPKGWKIAYQEGTNQLEFKYTPATDVDYDTLNHIIYWSEGDYTSSEPETGWNIINKGDTNTTPLEINTDDHGKTYTWYVKAQEVDYGLESVSNRVIFTVDLNIPVTEIEEVESYTNKEKLIIVATDIMDKTDPTEIYSDINRIVYRKIDLEGNQTAEIEISNLTMVEEGSWQGEIPLEEGEYTIQALAYDNAGNSSLQKNREVKVDYTSPEIIETSLDLPQEAGIYQSFKNKINLEIVMEDLVSNNYSSGLKRLNYWFVENKGDEIKQDAKVKNISFGSLPPYNLEIDISELEEGREYFLVLQAEDQAGNSSEIKYLNPIYIDRTPPVLSLDISGYKKYGSKNYLANLDSISINASATDNESEIKVQGFNIYSVKNGDYLKSEWVDWETLKKTSLIDGEEYQISFSATNAAGNKTTIMGQVFTYDNSGPANLELTLPTGKFISGETVIIKASASDTHSPIVSYRLAIGLEPGGKELTSKIAGNIDGYLDLESINNEYRLTLPEAENGVYHITLLVSNAAGAYTSNTDELIEIDNNQEKLTVSDEGPFTASDTELRASWRYTGEKKISRYRYRIKLKNGSYLTGEEYTNNTNITVTDLSLKTGETYQFEVLAEYSDGTLSPVVLSPGVRVDTTAAVVNYFNTPEYSTSKEIIFSWEGLDQESGILKVEVALGTDYNQTDATAGWVELVEGTLNTDSDGNPLNLTTGQHYYPMLRITNGAGIQTDFAGSSIIIDDTPAPAAIVDDHAKYINHEQPIIIDWTMTELQNKLDQESGNARYYWAYSTNKADLNLNNQSITWNEVKNDLKIRFNNISEIVSGEISDGTNYYFAIKTINGVGLASIGLTDGLVFDSSAPSIPELKVFNTINLDGQLVDKEVNYINSIENLKLWIAATDRESEVNKYMYAYDLQEEVAGAPRTPYLIEDENEYNQPQLIKIENPELIEGKIYKFAGESYNGSKLISQTGYSSGLILDTTTPRVINVNGIAAGDYLIFDWDVEENSSISSIVKYETALVTSPTEVPEKWENNGTSRRLKKDVSTLPDGQYYLKVRAYNAAGNYSRSGQEFNEIGISPVVILDRTAPNVTELEHKNYSHDVLDEVYIKARDNDYGSGINTFQYALGNYLNPTIYSGGWLEIINKSDQAVLEDQIKVSLNTLDIPHGEEIYLWARVKDNVNLWSETRKGKKIIVDHTPPEIESIIISGPEATNTTDKITGINMDFQNSDPESGISHYRIAVAKKKGGEWENSPDVRPIEEFFGMVNGLDLEEGDYYLAVELFNAVGLSTVKYSKEPVNIDLTPPVLTFINTDSEIVFNNPDAENPGEVKYTLSEDANVSFTLTYPDGLVQDYPGENRLAANETHIFNFTESWYGIYILRPVVVDKAGNSMELEVSKTIRVNQPPDIILPVEINTTPGKPIILKAYQIYDPDGGYITEFSWDTGMEGDILNEPAPEYKYYELGDYQLSLTVTDNDGGISSASTVVKVRNTSQGQLYINESWSGTHRIYGDILVPEGIKLTVLPDTKIIVDGIPGVTGYYHQIEIKGELEIKGKDDSKVQISSVNNKMNSWQGIKVSGLASINGSEIKDAFRAITIDETGQAEISSTTFKENMIGIHVYGSRPKITACIFNDNQLYGIKEDNGGRPIVINSIFSNNGIDYYHLELNKISLDALNDMEGNYGNVSQ